MLTAARFIVIWESFLADQLNDLSWSTCWESDSQWSTFLLGTKTSSSELSPLGNYFKAQLGESFGYRSEDGLVDLSFFDTSKSFRFSTLDNDWKAQTFERVDYPVSYLALIEHENKIYTSWQEIAKLSCFRAPLKVLITYYSSDLLTPEEKDKELGMLRSSFHQVLSQASAAFSENNTTEYLLIVGDKIEHALQWDYLVFDAGGRLHDDRLTAPI